MKRFLKTDEWNIIEERFNLNTVRKSESIFSLGNGRIGQRGNFEERFSGDSLKGAYVAGITFLDRTRVGWWKNGYPRFFSRIPNAPNWSGIDLRLIDEELDLAQWDVKSFKRRLNMYEGISYRDFEVTSPKGHSLLIHVEHINSMANQNLCAIKYSVTSINYEGKISFVPYINGDVKHESSNFDEKMWTILKAETANEYAYIWSQTKREDTQLCCTMTYQLFKNSQELNLSPIRIEKEKLTGFSAGADVKPGERLTLIKYTSVASTLYGDRTKLVEHSIAQAKQAKSEGWEKLVQAHKKIWEEIWEESDVVIKGDPEAQQGIRYNIFQLTQSYRGDDPRLNIGAKGFTGEKYGGNTQWNTELCCVPFFLLSNSNQSAHNLLLYRYNHLPKAIENARKLGFKQGAALYPMVTFNGDECHNEWEITFEEIHRNNIIAYAIVQYTVMTGNKDFIMNYGLEMMIAICRFWSQRVSFSKPKQQYVILGVTGPNEYENNVDNNWYTNYSCIETLKSTLLYLELAEQAYPEAYTQVCNKTVFQSEETVRWKEIIENLYLPEDKELNIKVQQDGYMDKELTVVADIPMQERPINQHWSWDRILRSCYIKQSDVLLGIYLYGENFDCETIRRNFHFYEPRTVHESSLSPYIHSILASRIGEMEKAYSHFLHATRLDLDDYNNELDEGLHITSMPGSWLAIVQGFAGMRMELDTLCFHPVIPELWDSYQFNINFRERAMQVTVEKTELHVTLLKGEAISIQVNRADYTVSPGSLLSVELVNASPNCFPAADAPR